MVVVDHVLPRSQSSDTGSSDSQRSYFFVAAAIIFCLLILRVLMLRRHNQSLSDFFRMRGGLSYSYGSNPNPPSDHGYGPMIHGLQLAPVPAAYHPDRRVRAMDTDAHGRRLDPVGENWDAKDALPAYDNFDRPPKYVETSWMRGGNPSVEQQWATTPEQSRTTYPNVSDGAPADGVSGQIHDPHAGGDHATEMPPTPTYHNLPGS